MSAAKAGERELPLRIVVEGPPAGVAFAVQRGRAELLAPSAATADAVTFDFPVRVGTSADGAPNFLGEYAHGTPGERFVYVTSGQSAGDAGSPWRRRAKVRLAGQVDWLLIDRVLSQPGALLEARITGTSRDGGPVCASTPVLGGGWTVVPPA